MIPATSLRLVVPRQRATPASDPADPRLDASAQHLACAQAGLLRYISTGNLALDIVSAAVIALGIRLLMPETTLSEHVMLDMLVLASIPVLRSGRVEDAREKLNEYAATIYAKWQNRYITTIEFEREASPTTPLPFDGTPPSARLDVGVLSE